MTEPAEVRLRPSDLEQLAHAFTQAVDRVYVHGPDHLPSAADLPGTLRFASAGETAGVVIVAQYDLHSDTTWFRVYVGLPRPDPTGA